MEFSGSNWIVNCNQIYWAYTYMSRSIISDNSTFEICIVIVIYLLAFRLILKFYIEVLVNKGMEEEESGETHIYTCSVCAYSVPSPFCIAFQFRLIVRPETQLSHPLMKMSSVKSSLSPQVEFHHF